MISNKSMDECVICFEKNINVKLNPCNHKYCLKCALIIYFLHKKCSFCTRKIKSVITIDKENDLSKETAIMWSEPANPFFFKFLMNFIKNLSVKDNLLEAIETITEIYLDFHPKVKNYILSLVQCEELLVLAKQNLSYNQYYAKLEQFLVCLCQTPWLVDVKLASSGVCYFGDFGDTPSILRTIGLLNYNNQYIRKNNWS